MRKLGIKLITTVLLVTMLIGGYSNRSVSAASDISMKVMRYTSADKGTTRAEIFVQGMPEDAKGLQFDLITNPNAEQVTMKWNPKLATEYAYVQDKALAADKVQRTYYIVAKSLPIESNSLYVGEVVFKHKDVSFETTGELKYLGDKLQETNVSPVKLLVETKSEDSGGGDNSGGEGDNGGNDGGNGNDNGNGDGNNGGNNGGDNGNGGNGSGGSQGGGSGGNQGQTPPDGDGGKPEPEPQPDKGQENTGTKPSEPVTFSDIKGHWAAASIQYVAEKGIMNGTSKDKFEPQVTMTRAMFVQTLFNTEKVLYQTSPMGKASSFKDVSSGIWYEDAVNWAVEQGIASGVGNQMFEPEQEISREQMAVMLYNYCKLKEFTLNTSEKKAVFKDQDQISSWALEAVTAVQQAGLMNGMSEHSFEPKAKSKRAEVAAVFERLAKSMLAEK